MQNVLYPDSVVGTDSHTTMINGLGIVGWGKKFYLTIEEEKSENVNFIDIIIINGHMLYVCMYACMQLQKIIDI